VRTRSSNSVTTEDILNALGRYTRESDESDRQTAAKLGINRLTLEAWLRGVVPPQRYLVARLAGFLRRTGYL
jgi:transcriptional regulator with XRE-family HTH domain